jgi:hypothetical protein
MEVKLLDSSFLFNQIRAYNQALKPKLKDKILAAIGIYAGLIPKSAALRELSADERQTCHFFLTEFCQYQGLEVRISESRLCFIKAQHEEIVESKL